MITIHIDNTTDGHTLVHCYEGIENNIVLVNPRKDDVIKTLRENPNDLVLALGHGSPMGLFSATEWGMSIDGTMSNLLVGRECVFIWCHAKQFAKKINGFKGFATSMFISNPSEASCFRMKDVAEEVTQAENIFFADRVCDLLKRNVPLNEWVDILRTDYHKEYDFSVFNMEGDGNDGGIEYFDGTKTEIIPSVYEYGWDDTTIVEERDTKEIVKDMGNSVDDLKYYLNELRFKMGFNDSLEYDGDVITKTDLDKWEGVLEEMERFSYFI